MPERPYKAPIGVVIPGYGHPQFLAEAVISACEQEIDRDVFVVVVDDGCRFPETGHIVADLIKLYPGTLHYLRQSNTRLPGARNTGIRFLLELKPEIDSIFFLDADNRLAPYSLASFRDALGDDPSVGWAYPDISMFGQSLGDDGFDTRETAPEYSILKHLVGNISEAGSLVRAEVFRAGVFYNEQMTQGYEDWDFWLSALEAGFVGQRAPFSGFLYRRRPESMLADSRRLSEMLIAQIRDTHKSLYAPKSILALEQAEAPSFAVYIYDTKNVLLTSDLKLEPRAVSLTTFQDMLHDYCHNEREAFFPEYLIGISRYEWEFLQRHPQYIRWVMWRVREQQHDVASVTLDAASEFAVKTKPAGPDTDQLHTNFVAVRFSALRERLRGTLLSAAETTHLAVKRYEMFQAPKVENRGFPSKPLHEQLEQIEGFIDSMMPLRQRFPHQTRKYAGPSCVAIRSELVNEICAVEDRQPFPVHSGKARVLTFVKAEHLESELASSRLAVLLKTIRDTGYETFVVLEVAPRKALDTIDLGWWEYATDVVPLTLSGVSLDHKIYQGRRISQELGLTQAEDVTVLARSCDILIACGAVAGLEALGEAKAAHGAKGVVWLDQAFMADDSHDMGLQAKLLAFEHAVSTVITDDQDYIYGLAAEGFPPSKFMSYEMFWQDWKSAE